MAKKRIAILGGGMSSLVTAFELTSKPGWDAHYDITVYQTGFRLGGKGASGRNPDVHERIEEHGLHIMFGFYDNVFRVMKQAYSEMGRAPSMPLATWEEAFKPHDLIVMMEKCGETYQPWEVSPPRNELEPGTEGLLMGPFDYLVKLLEHSVHRFHTWTERTAHAEIAAASRQLGTGGLDLQSVREQVRAIVGVGERLYEEGVGLVESLENGLWNVMKSVFSGDPRQVVKTIKGEFAYLDLAHGLARGGAAGVNDTLDSGDPESITWLLRRFLEWLWKQAEDVTTEFRRLRIELDFALTVALGMVVDGLILPPVNWFKIDDMDFRAWLKKHGARAETIESPLVMGLYDAIFSTNQPMGAGTIVHLLLLMGFTYKTAVNYKMQAGMGDTVFTPLYLTLKRRGVRFEFFHCVNEIKLSADKKRVERIEIGVQATLAPGVVEYDPLVNVKDLLSWPSVPRYQQLAQGGELKEKKVDLEDWWTDWKDVDHKTLVVDKDFDVCVLGISVGAFRYICKDMIEDQANPQFKTMVDSIVTTQTAAAQLWFQPDLAQTGWKTSSHELPIVIPYVEPLDTWCDMTQLVCRETWPPNLPVGSCHYLCSNMVDVEPMPPRDQHGYAQRQNQRVHDMTLTWLEENVHWLWPNAAMPASKNELNWWWLVDAKNQQGRQRFESQYWHAPVSPSERYNLSVPKSSWARLRPNESGYPNLVLTGDWTLTSLSAGCLEAATMSGIASANAVDGGKRRIWNDWLPASGPIGPASAPGGDRQIQAHVAPSVLSIEEASAKPAFIQRDGILIAAPPVYMTADVYMFMLEADMNALQAMCDRYLNIGGKTVYKPLLPFITLYLSNLNSTPMNDPIGWCPEKDFGFWVPVVAGQMVGPLFIPEAIRVFTPYLWVDTGVAMVGGREVFGFAKELGVNMVMPGDVTKPARFSCETLVIPTFGKDATTVYKPILEVHKAGGGFWDEVKQGWSDAETMFKAFEEVLKSKSIDVPDGALAWQLFSTLGKEMPCVFLKQFPDVEYVTRACYQAIVDSPITITSGVQGGIIPGDYSVSIYGYDSHHIVENLGLKVAKQDGNRSELRSLVHGWTKFDGVVDKGKVVYEKK